MSKLRMEQRRTVTTFTPVYDLDHKSRLGYLGDLTINGALLVSEKPIEAEQTLSLAIEFREDSQVPVRPRMIPARVVWCKPEEHHTYYKVGMKFLSVTPPTRKVIEQKLQKLPVGREAPAYGTTQPQPPR